MGAKVKQSFHIPKQNMKKHVIMYLFFSLLPPLCIETQSVKNVDFFEKKVYRGYGFL
jgi:hypothetical protein